MSPGSSPPCAAPGRTAGGRPRDPSAGSRSAAMPSWPSRSSMRGWATAPRRRPRRSAQRDRGERLEVGLAGAQPRVGGELGVVAADHRQIEHPRQQPRAQAGRARGTQVDQVVAALGDRVDDRRHARHPDLQAPVEGDVDLGHRAQPPVDVGVGADHLDVEPGDAALADLLERVRDPVHPADPVGDQRDPRPVASLRVELGLLTPEERGCGGVRDRRDAGVEQRDGAAPMSTRSPSVGSPRSRRPRRRACARGSAALGGRGRGG